ncbi:hypothetical protein Tco_0649865 [Tanacetum coccineum]
MPLHKSKTLKKDSFPKPSQYNAEVYDFLRTHTAPFWKFPKPFLFWVGISCYYELDKNNYPYFLDDNNEAAMDLFSFIHHADPTKVRVGVMEKAGHQVSLLEATRERVVPLSPLVPVNATSSEGNMTESIDRLFDEANDAEKEHFTGGGEYVALTEAIVEPVYEDVAEKPRRLKKKRKAAGDASGSTLPSKKLRDDYGTSATVPLVTSFMTPTPEREGGDHTDSVPGPNLYTKPAAVRFVISSDLSHHSGTHAMDVEVSSLVRSTVSDPPVMTAAVTTTSIVETPLVLVSKVTIKPVNPTLFGDSMSTSEPDGAGHSSLIHPELSVYSFYAIQDLNPKTLHRLYTEFNVGAACQTCLSAEVRMRAEHTLRKKKILEEDCTQQTNLLKEKDVEIASLKSQLSLKEAEAAEAIRLRGHVATVEAIEALHAAELNLLKERNSTLAAKMRASEEKVAALEFEKSGLTDHVSSLETTCVELRNQVAGYELFKEQIKAVQDEQVKVLIEKIVEVDANLMGMALQFDDERAVDKGMKDGLVASIEHGKAGRTLSNVAAYNPSADADYVAAVSTLRDVDFSLLDLLVSQKDASIADIMYSLRRIRRDTEARRLSLFDAMVPFIEPLSSENLLGEASTFGVPITVDVVTTLSTTFAQYVSVLVPLLLVADYGVVHAGPHVEDPSSGKEELELLLNLLRVVEPAIMAVLPTKKEIEIMPLPLQSLRGNGNIFPFLPCSLLRGLPLALFFLPNGQG